MLISELCRRANVSRELVRHYESLELIYSTPRQAGSRSYRDFNEHQLERLELIAQGKAIGFTLKQIKPMLEAYLNNEMGLPEQITLMTAHRAEINTKIQELQRIDQYLQEKMALLEQQIATGNTDPAASRLRMASSPAADQPPPASQAVHGDRATG